MSHIPIQHTPHVDLFGVPLQVGDKVLTTGYQDVAFNYITTITKATKTKLFITIDSVVEYNYDSTTRQHVRTVVSKTIARSSSQLIRIQPLLNYNLEHYPEISI